MKLVLKDSAPEGFALGTMQDGDIAIIVKFDDYKDIQGRAAQRYKSVLIVLGERSGQCYPDIFGGGAMHEAIRIRPLTAGETLIYKQS